MLMYFIESKSKLSILTLCTTATAMEETGTKKEPEYEYNSLTLNEMDEIKDLADSDYPSDAGSWVSLDTELVNNTKLVQGYSLNHNKSNYSAHLA